MLAYNSTPPVFALYLSQRFGINETNIGWFFIVFGVVGVLMRAFVVGPINARLGEVRTMRLGAVLYGLGYLLIPLARSVPVFLVRSEEHTSELQSRLHLVCRLLLEKKKKSHSSSLSSETYITLAHL